MNRWPITRYLLGSHTIFLVFLLAGVYLFVAVVVGAVATFRDIRISGVDVVGQILPWVTAGYGTTTAALLATVLVHGRTRREFLIQHPVFQVITTGLIAALITGVYAIETAVYRAFDWGQKVQDERAYATTSEYATIFGAYWSMLLIWLMVGVFLGMAFYRWEGSGVLALIPAGVIVVVTGGVNGFLSLPFARTDLPLLPVTVAAVAITYAMLWYTGRDVALRARVA
ncbi:hypothetical protein ACTI_62690 [Actinoplanes sp. OR16]|uniref:hypothetical protein n=1 Tax=Actinoplanes sp. OR16 TaxID=946334 RepID=UPI000F70627A|nr:hypothetical protein [Actinoplanes sp. OR16]BBH69584.1 hypothetical protein ACTI_62690 [Actinoplanes sp. OR16]